MCQLCQQLGLDLHKFNVIDADANGLAAPGAPAWAVLPDTDGPEPDGQNPGFDTVPGSTATSFTISSGTSQRGYVNSGGEQDWYSINLVAGQTYTFALSGFGIGALSDAYLRLLNSSGTQIAFDDDSGPINNSRLTFTASTTGTYYVSAGGFGSATGQYLLTMNTGSTPYAPVVTVSDIANYLTNSYWEVNGSIAHHWGVSSITYNVQGLEPERAALARLAFQLWSEVCNLTFVETTGAAQITLDDNQSGAFASSSYNGSGIISSASINVDNDWYGGIDAIDSYTLQTFIHEIGHTIGLGHGGPYNGSATYGVDNTYANDTWQLSLMSYMDQSDYGSASYRFTLTPMMADILAVQNLYGAATTRTGNTVYGFNSTAGSFYNFSSYSQAPALTIYDSGGTDTLDCSGYGQSQVINLTGGSFCNVGGLIGNIGIYATSVIENAVGGSGNDTITGNSANNVLTGGGGNDTLNGGGGNDSLTGGAGDDMFVYTAGLDTIADFAAGAGGIDEIDLRSFVAIQTLADVLALATQSGANTVINFGSGNTLTLQNVTMTNLVSGDFIFSSPATPSDLTASGLVLDAAGISFTIRNMGAALAGASAAGVYLSTDGTITTGDTLLTAVATPSLVGGGVANLGTTLTFPANLAPATYCIGVLADYNAQITEGSETNNASNIIAVMLGNSSANSLVGTSGGDTIMGLGGDDTLDGGAGNDWIDGGSGADRMYGRGGYDIYVVDHWGDVVVENAGEGYDTVNSYLDYTLPLNVEKLVLVGTGDTNAFGNASNNDLVGNSRNNYLDGRGGGDWMYGGAGDDFYYIDHPGDATIEYANEGYDTIYCSWDCIMPANIEKLFLIGAANVNAIGNALNNDLVGNPGNNYFDGGAGADWMYGGLGNDVYLIEGSDAVIEYANEGYDSIYTSGNCTLPSNIEALYFLGSSNLVGVGNALNNDLFGNSGANILAGGGGNDAYVIHNSATQIIEYAGEGYDQVYADVDFTLPANVEALTFSGTGNLTGIGNVLNNDFFSNGSANTFAGGGGNDAYVIHNVADQVIENAGEGTDTVFADVSFSLGANIERLTLTGSANLNGAGNGLDNILTGNSGNNTLTGNGGSDRFVIGQGSGYDTITDFDADDISAGHDIIDLSGRGLSFGGLSIMSAGGDTVIDLPGGDTILLLGVSPAAINASDFLF